MPHSLHLSSRLLKLLTDSASTTWFGCSIYPQLVNWRKKILTLRRLLK